MKSLIARTFFRSKFLECKKDYLFMFLIEIEEKLNPQKSI